MGLVRDRRPQALGDFFSLPDELLCSIIGSLPPRTVGNLACVSRCPWPPGSCTTRSLQLNCTIALHVSLGQCIIYFVQRGAFVDAAVFGSTPRWIFELRRLLASVSSPQVEKNVLQLLASEGGSLCRLGYITKGTTLKPPMCFDGFSSLFLYKRWYRCNIALQGFAVDTGVIDRRENLSLEEFRATYDGKKPVLITDLTKDWPAQKSWNLSQLVENYGEVAFKVSQSHGKKIKMSLKDYASYMACQHDEEPLYIFDAKFGELAPKMLEEYSVPPLFKEDFLSVLDKPVRPPFRWLVVGPARSGASWHVDPALTSAWNTLLSGCKRWALYPPGRVPPAVIVHVDEDDGSVNFDGPTSLQWWLEIYPTLRDEDKPLECTQLPGETIMVPSGWWHCVLNIDDSIAVTQNYVNSVNLELVCLDMAPGYQHRGIARAGRLALEESLQRTSKGVRECQGINGATHEGHISSAVGLQDEVSHKGKVNDPENYGLYIDVDNLATYTEKQSNHFISRTSKGGYLDRSELRDWLRRLWKLRPDLHQRLWKCACIAVDAGSWLERVTAICKANGLPLPLDEEQLPVGNGSNPVYLVGEYVIKLCVEEDGPMVAIEGLRSELQFYALLSGSGSELQKSIPSIVASGIVLPNGKGYKVIPWDGSTECPASIDARNIGKKRQRDEPKFDKSQCRSKWYEAEFARVPIGENNDDNENSLLGKNGQDSVVVVEDPMLWPFLVQKRCEGTNLDRVLEKMTKEDYAAVSSFLGEKIRLLHSFPLPATLSRRTWTQKTTRLVGKEPICVADAVIANGKQHIQAKDQPDPPKARDEHPECYSFGKKTAYCEVPTEWQYFVGLMREQRVNAMERFEDWESLPSKLQKQLETYLPEDPAVLVGLQKVTNGLAKSSRPPVWLHMDVMTDNIQMAPYSGDDHVPGLVDLDQITCGNHYPSCKQHETTWNESHDNKRVSQDNMESRERAMQAHYIIDFGDVAHGDPLYEFLALHISVFKLDPVLLKLSLRAYGLPLTIPDATGNVAIGGALTDPSSRDYTQPSYRAMCYCLLHEQDAMGAILKQRKDLRTAETLEEIELKLWGVLNEWDPAASSTFLK